MSFICAACEWVSMDCFLLLVIQGTDRGDWQTLSSHWERNVLQLHESQLNNQFQFQILIFFCSFKETESGNDNTLKNMTPVNEAGVQNYSNRNSLLPKSTIFCWSLINVVIFSFCLPNPVHFRDSSSSGKPDCFPDVPSRFLNCPENSEQTKVVGVGDTLTVRISTEYFLELFALHVQGVRISNWGRKGNESSLGGSWR